MPQQTKQQTNEDIKINMSNTEETQESSRKRSSFVDDFLESGRKKVKTSLSTDDKHIDDLEYMLKSAKALVKIINEIWDNCEEHLTSSEDDDNSPFTFEREVFEEVKVEKDGRELVITTEKVPDTKDFGSPPDLPEDLSNLVCIGPIESDILPDYNKYLEKSSILCEVVLLPFLTGLKEHLENVQVFVGKIEEWLLEPRVIDSFLNQNFDGPGCLRCESKIDPSITFLYCSYCLDVNSKVESTHNLCTEKGRQGLKAALAFMKTFEPITQIEVKDAGEKAVNGTYTLAGVHDGVYGYTRSGLWDGNHTKFYLLRHEKRKKWCIHCMDASKNFIFFYWTNSTGKKHELPPMDGWGIEGNISHGVNPPPKILYKIDD